VFLAASNGSNPMLIMGGGYDTCEDANPNTCTASSKGHSIYVVDATSGSLIQAFPTSRSVVADVVVVPDPTTGLALYAYAADLGGNIYRIDIGNGSLGQWKFTRIASLGCSTAAICSQNRKFLFAPDVLLDSNGGYILLLGSGDREKPLLYSNPVTDYFFMIKDKPATGTWLTSENANCGGNSVICLGSLLGITAAATPSAADLAAKKGWYLGLAAGEQVVTAALTIFGSVTFSTHQPAQPQAGSCASNLGVARVYNVSFTNASSENATTQRYQDLPADIGLPPSPVGGMVTLDNGQTVPFCIGCSPDSPLQAEEPTAPPGSMPGQPKRRVYWYIQH